VKYLAPTFNRKLSLLSGSESSTKKIPLSSKAAGRSISALFSRFVTFSPVEKASFVFTWKMTARSRDFKLKVYPAMGYLIVYAAFLLFSNKKINLDSIQDNPTTTKWMLLSAVYLSIFLLSMAIGQMVFSDKYKASWIYYTSPVTKPGHIITGAAKAVLLKFFFPSAATLSTIAFFIAGPQILPNLLFGLSNVVLIIGLMLYAGNHYFPFSTLQSTNAKTGGFMKGMFILFISGLIAVGHFLIYSFLPVVIICTVLSFIAVWLLFSSIMQLEWKKILSAYEEG
jgi:hypothetical protein